MIIEFDDVYLEYPDNLKNTLDEENIENTSDEKKLKKPDEEKKEIVNTTKISLEELQKKLEETQSLRL